MARSQRRHPYDLDSPAGRYELGKDVSAFANNSGGFIIIGLTTEVNQAQQTETITAITPFPQEAIHPHRYISIVEEYIHPNIEHFRAAWVPTDPEQSQGIAIIEVPPQNQERQYFLITNVVEAGANIKQIVFGVVVRNGSSNEPFNESSALSLYPAGQEPHDTITRLHEREAGRSHRAISAPAPGRRPRSPVRRPSSRHSRRARTMTTTPPRPSIRLLHVRSWHGLQEFL